MHSRSRCTTDRETRLNSLSRNKHPCHKSRETCRIVLILVHALRWILIEKPLDYFNHCQTFDSFFLSVFLRYRRIFNKWYFNQIFFLYLPRLEIFYRYIFEIRTFFEHSFYLKTIIVARQRIYISYTRTPLFI